MAKMKLICILAHQATAEHKVISFTCVSVQNEKFNAKDKASILFKKDLQEQMWHNFGRPIPYFPSTIFGFGKNRCENSLTASEQSAGSRKTIIEITQGN